MKVIHTKIDYDKDYVTCVLKYSILFRMRILQAGARGGCLLWQWQSMIMLHFSESSFLVSEEEAMTMLYYECSMLRRMATAELWHTFHTYIFVHLTLK